jgi:primosomal protein N'
MGPTQDSYFQVQPLGGFDKPLTYRNNFNGKESIEPGSLVTIPLGKRKITGIVWAP